MLDAATYQASVRLDPILVARPEIQLRHANVLINAQQLVIAPHEADSLQLAASVTGMLGQSSAVLGRVVHQAGDFMAIGNSMQTGHEGVIRRQRSNNVHGQARSLYQAAVVGQQHLGPAMPFTQADAAAGAYQQRLGHAEVGQQYGRIYGFDLSDTDLGFRPEDGDVQSIQRIAGQGVTPGQADKGHAQCDPLQKGLHWGLLSCCFLLRLLYGHRYREWWRSAAAG